MGSACLFAVIPTLPSVEWRQEDGLVHLEGSSIFLFMIDTGVYSMIRSNKQREKFCSMRIEELVFIYLEYMPY